VPTFQATPQFERDWKLLTPDLRVRFQRVVAEQFVPDLAKGTFRAGLRVKGVQAAAGVSEMTWAPDGRATFSYGRRQQRPGEPHVICRRIGTHQIFRDA
jgi:hypothetical protein